jgi:plastocyanin
LSTYPYLNEEGIKSMNHLSRRTLVGGLIATPLVAVGLGRVLAQNDSTPESTPDGSPEASPNASPGASPMASPSAGGERIEVTAVDIKFEEDELEMPADTDVTVVLHNEGFLQHDFAIEDTDFITELTDAGESAEIVVNLPAGDYTYYCTVPGHREAGMEGTLKVK